MTKNQALPYVSYIVDDALNFRKYNETIGEIQNNAIFVGWQCGFEPLFVACQSYLSVKLDEDEAIELATDGLEEIGWFGANGKREPDYVIDK